jgi:hypothetical protein
MSKVGTVKIIRKATILILTSGLLLCSCGIKTGVRQDINDFRKTENGFIEETVKKAYATDVKILDILENLMTKMLSNEYAELYLGKFNDMALLDKRTGAVFFSNYSLYSDNAQSVADIEKSQLVIEFFDNADTLFTMSSFPECIDGKDKNQTEVKVENNSLRILYKFGTRQDDRLIAPAFSAGTYDMILEKADGLKAEGKLTAMAFGRFKTGYLHLVYDSLSDTEKSIYAKKYKKLPELKELYVLKEDRTNLQKKEIENVTKILEITKADIEKELSTIGEIEGSQFLSPYFEIPLEFALDKGDLIVSIDTPKIIEQKTYFLTKINILNNFGALDKSVNGFIFMPDKSGTVIRTKGNDSIMNSLSMRFYGSDFGIEQNDASKLLSYAPFPVFGFGDESKSVFATVESGEALSGVTAELAGSASDYSKAYAWYSYRMADDIDLSGLETKNTKKVFSKKIEKNPFIMRFHFIYGENSDYNGMADYYRKYLLQTKTLTKNENSRYELDLSFIGAFDKKQMWFGLQTKKSIAATDFTKAREILEQLEIKGVKNYSVNYFGAMNGGIEYSVYNSINFEGVLGGDKGFDELSDFLKKRGNSLFPVFDFSVVYKKGNGLDQNRQLSRYLNKNFAVITEYLPSENTSDKTSPGYQISPSSFNDFAVKISKGYKKFGNNSIYIDKAGSYLSADYAEGSEITREQSKYAVMSSLSKIKGQGYDLKVNGANTYVLPYADSLTDIPVNHSEYMISSYSVPFVGMVLHGYMPYSGPPLNQQGNYKISLLKSIESGSKLSYTLMGEDPVIFSGTRHNRFYSMTAQTWIEDIKSEYLKAESLLGKLQDSGIVKHKYLTDSVVQVTYSNGKSIVINYAKTPYLHEGQTIEGLSYSLVE